MVTFSDFPGIHRIGAFRLEVDEKHGYKTRVRLALNKIEGERLI